VIFMLKTEYGDRGDNRRNQRRRGMEALLKSLGDRRCASGHVRNIEPPIQVCIAQSRAP